MSIYVSAHYKNSPNDLQMLSDAPAHHVFVLLPPVDHTANKLPEILGLVSISLFAFVNFSDLSVFVVVIQVTFEGELRTSAVEASFARGKRASGDLIPWTISQQFQDSSFASLAGARIIRIATHPEYQRMGFGLKGSAFSTFRFLSDFDQISSYFQPWSFWKATFRGYLCR